MLSQLPCRTAGSGPWTPSTRTRSSLSPPSAETEKATKATAGSTTWVRKGRQSPDNYVTRSPNGGLICFDFNRRGVGCDDRHCNMMHACQIRASHFPAPRRLWTLGQRQAPRPKWEESQILLGGGLRIPSTGGRSGAKPRKATSQRSMRLKGQPYN